MRIYLLWADEWNVHDSGHIEEVSGMEHQMGKKEQILQAAFSLYLNMGYEATTVRMICKEAEVEPPTLYHYFGSKKDLFFAVVTNLITEYRGLYQELFACSKCEPKEALQRIYKGSVEYAMRYTQATKFYLRYTLFAPQELQEDLDQYMYNTYQIRNKQYKDCLERWKIISSQAFEVEEVCDCFERFVNSATFHVVFSNWTPDSSELDHNFQRFWNEQIKNR